MLLLLLLAVVVFIGRLVPPLFQGGASVSARPPPPPTAPASPANGDVYVRTTHFVYGFCADAPFPFVCLLGWGTSSVSSFARVRRAHPPFQCVLLCLFVLCVCLLLTLLQGEGLLAISWEYCMGDQLQYYTIAGTRYYT